MSIFVLKPFDRNLKRYSISEEKLFSAAREIMAGQYEADLGGGVFKKRIALDAGKSGGARSVIIFKYGGNLFFVNGWSKSDIKKSWWKRDCRRRSCGIPNISEAATRHVQNRGR